ncbi:hypothetical protein EDB85DRAFT_2279811 [Lactarius pseudohatsudake]|nr:hypothetical protein EDB85DRAFT_2279811 [Lactarius pseudohatsudake]
MGDKPPTSIVMKFAVLHVKPAMTSVSAQADNFAPSFFATGKVLTLNLNATVTGPGRFNSGELPAPLLPWQQAVKLRTHRYDLGRLGACKRLRTLYNSGKVVHWPRSEGKGVDQKGEPNLGEDDNYSGCESRHSDSGMAYERPQEEKLTVDDPALDSDPEHVLLLVSESLHQTRLAERTTHPAAAISVQAASEAPCADGRMRQRTARARVCSEDERWGQHLGWVMKVKVRRACARLVGAAEVLLRQPNDVGSMDRMANEAYEGWEVHVGPSVGQLFKHGICGAKTCGRDPTESKMAELHIS